MDGGYGVECLCQGEGYRGWGEWGRVRVSCLWYLGGGLCSKPWGRGGKVFGGKAVMVQLWIGPSKSSQSLSIAHKWAVVID
ncbi:hypothetical protein Tco_0488494 [Tanacetum coccineum]